MKEKERKKKINYPLWKLSEANCYRDIGSIGNLNWHGSVIVGQTNLKFREEIEGIMHIDHQLKC